MTLRIEHKSTNQWITNALFIECKYYWPTNWRDMIYACVFDNVESLKSCLDDWFCSNSNANDLSHTLTLVNDLPHSFILNLFRVNLIHDGFACSEFLIPIVAQQEMYLISNREPFDHVVLEYDILHNSIKSNNRRGIKYSLGFKKCSEKKAHKYLAACCEECNVIAVDTLLGYYADANVEVCLDLILCEVLKNWVCDKCVVEQILCLIRLLLFNGANACNIDDGAWKFIVFCASYKKDSISFTKKDSISFTYILRVSSDATKENAWKLVQDSMENLAQNCY